MMTMNKIKLLVRKFYFSLVKIRVLPGSNAILAVSLLYAMSAASFFWGASDLMKWFTE